MAKTISAELATPYLNSQGVKIGVWNELTPIESHVKTLQSAFCTGKSVYELINFSTHVAGWLVKGEWKILQIDNSSFFYPDQAAVLSALLLGPSHPADLVKQRTFLFEFDADLRTNFQTEVVLAHIINLMLIYGAHCYLISAGGRSGEMVAVQDGFVYFYGNDGRITQAKELLHAFEVNPNSPASWIDAGNEEHVGAD